MHAKTNAHTKISKNEIMETMKYKQATNMLSNIHIKYYESKNL